LAWISAAEGALFASKIKEMQEIVSQTSEEEMERSREMLN
jgi:coenzyme F420-reducing hydrogenase delta subunit